ncbi:MAG: TlpA disulfide reductase family protein, partial [Chloroflexota bacterium]
AWVNFWSSWCPAYRTEMPRLEKFWLQHNDEGLVILGVGVRDDRAIMRVTPTNWASRVRSSLTAMRSSPPRSVPRPFPFTIGSTEGASFGTGRSGNCRPMPWRCHSI